MKKIKYADPETENFFVYLDGHINLYFYRFG